MNNDKRNKRLPPLATKAQIKVEQDKTKKSYFISHFMGKSHFEEGNVQNYLVFQPINR